MLVVEALQSVSNDLGSVVAQAVTQAIELTYKVLCGPDPQNLVTTGSCSHELLSYWINKTTLVYYLVNAGVL